MRRRSRKVRRARLSGASAARPTPEPQTALPRSLWAWAGGVFVALLAVYQQTVLRTVVDIDSGELVAAVHVQGIPHPTGYPLWLLLGRLFDCLPLGHSSAYRVGMMSGTAVAATGGLITLAAGALTGQAIPAAAAGMAFGLWSSPWGDSARAMVHAMSGLFVILAVMALRRWDRERSPKALWLLSLACGVAVMHHRTAALAIGIGFLAAFLLTPPRTKWAFVALAWLGLTVLAAYAGSSVVALAMAAVFLGLLGFALSRWRALETHLVSVALLLAPFSLYLYLWWRSLQHPPVFWSDLDTFSRLMYHVFGKHYSHFAFEHRGIVAMEEAGKTLAQLLVPNAVGAVLVFLIAAPLMVWGWWAWWRREPMLALCMGAGVVGLTVWVMHWGESSDLKHFLTPAGPTLALSGAMGMGQLATVARLRGPRWAPSAVVGAALCGMLLAGNWPQYDFSNRWANRDRWAVVLQQMEPNAVFVSDFDQPSYVSMYLQNVEGLRRDVTVLRATRLSDPGYVELIPDREVRDAVRESRPPAGFADLDELHEWVASLCRELAQRLPRRAVYALHGPMRAQAPGPPHFVNLSEDLVRVQLEPPHLIAGVAKGGDLGQFPNGAALAGFGSDRAEAGAGEVVGFTVWWRLSQPLPPSQFGVALVPPGMKAGDLTPGLLQDVRLVEGFFCLNGLWGTPPADEGICYQQYGVMIVPSNAPSGKYRVAVAVAGIYSTEYRGWIEVGELEVNARPLPRNGP